jgi:hypothetical protein
MLALQAPFQLHSALPLLILLFPFAGLSLLGIYDLTFTTDL